MIRLTWHRFAKRAVIGLSSLALAFMLAAGTASATDLFPDTPEVCGGAGKSSAACSGTDKNNLSGTDGIIIRAATIIALIGGIVAVVMIIVGGFTFITSGGDSGKVETAKKTLMYAVVGLIVIALARTIIVFVVTRV